MKDNHTDNDKKDKAWYTFEGGFFCGLLFIFVYVVWTYAITGCLYG